MTQKIDPYTKEAFIPSRQNQVYKNRKNQIAANNVRIKQRRQSKYRIDKILNRNREVLLSELGNLLEKEVFLRQLIEKGFIDGYQTHQKQNNKGEICKCIYEFDLHTLNTEKIKIKKNV